MQPFAANFYPQPLPPHFQNASIAQQYSPYPPQPYVHSPPPQQIPQYAPSPQISQQSQSFSRPQASPVVSSEYRPAPQAPSSSPSSHTVPVPTAPAPAATPPPPAPQPTQSVAPSFTPEVEPTETPFKAPVSPWAFLQLENTDTIELPWLSNPELPWPARKPRRKRKAPQQKLAEPVELPIISQENDHEVDAEVEPEKELEKEPEAEVVAEPRIVENVPRPETPTTSRPASEDIHSTAPTTPSSSNQTQLVVAGDITPVATIPTKRSTKPVVPIVPALPKTIPKESSRKVPGKSVEEEQPAHIAPPSTDGIGEVSTTEPVQAEAEEVKTAAPAPKAWITPKAWAGFFNPATAAATASSDPAATTAVSSFAKPNSESLGDALRSFDPVSNDSNIAFIEPRGLVNTGNMCYMNSVHSLIMLLVTI
jgi:ubiquitin carboxyl-terminal hydrolase 10